MSRLSDPNRPSELPLAPTTPRWRLRHLGVLAALLLAIALAAGAWQYRERAEQPNNNSVPIPAAR